MDDARAAWSGFDTAFAAGDYMRTAAMNQYLADLMVALERDEGEKLSDKSAEAARFILHVMDRELDRA